MKLFLWGFMGCGKSMLRKKLGLPGFDFDEELLARFGNSNESIGPYIQRIGWESFRKAEFDLYNGALNGPDRRLYALGGGALCDPSFPGKWPNGENEILIWLKVDPELCWERVKNDNDRPLVLQGKDAFFELYDKRKAIYQKSHFHFADPQNAEEYILDAIGRSL